jgi:hypothetical protein
MIVMPVWPELEDSSSSLEYMSVSCYACLAVREHPGSYCSWEALREGPPGLPAFYKLSQFKIQKDTVFKGSGNPIEMPSYLYTTENFFHHTWALQGHRRCVSRSLATLRSAWLRSCGKGMGTGRCGAHWCVAVPRRSVPQVEERHCAPGVDPGHPRMFCPAGLPSRQ